MNTDAKIMTVIGEIEAGRLGIVDAHNHVWIEPVPGAAPGNPVLVQAGQIQAELQAYRLSGGGGLTDCQPPGCGRNGLRLEELSRLSRVAILGCTGFHLPKYYPPDFWLFHSPVDDIARFFLNEIYLGMEETRPSGKPVYPSFIKVACQASLAQTSPAALEAAANAASQTGLAVGIHTEKGADAENIVAYFTRQGLRADRLVLFHIDKRPDLGLQRELALAGVLLEYDTFYRPKYDPEHRLWPLIEQMVTVGLEDSLALGTDMAEGELWRNIGGGPGLIGLPEIILPRLRRMGLKETSIQKLAGQNLVKRLIRRPQA